MAGRKESARKTGEGEEGARGKFREVKRRDTRTDRAGRGISKYKGK